MQKKAASAVQRKNGLMANVSINIKDVYMILKFEGGGLFVLRIVSHITTARIHWHLRLGNVRV